MIVIVLAGGWADNKPVVLEDFGLLGQAGPGNGRLGILGAEQALCSGTTRGWRLTNGVHEAALAPPVAGDKGLHLDVVAGRTAAGKGGGSGGGAGRGSGRRVSRYGFVDYARGGLATRMGGDNGQGG